ncbi:hypothetical protein MMC07_003690 [Pseudocyphellaria aurata]|nr:hypothetical protein [Pseudocyphellaria aurata]
MSMAGMIQHYGDIQLPPGADPGSYTTSEDVTVFWGSSLAHGHLTYGVLEAALEALRVVLIDQHHYNEARFTIYKTGIGAIGGGRISGPRQ